MSSPTQRIGHISGHLQRTAGPYVSDAVSTLLSKNPKDVVSSFLLLMKLDPRQP